MNLRTNEEAIRIIYQCAMDYKNNLSNKCVLFITTTDKKATSFETLFLPQNFKTDVRDITSQSTRRRVAAIFVKQRGDAYYKQMTYIAKGMTIDNATLKVPLTFCGCCGGHIRNNYQKSLGVNLRLKEIVSSSSNSKGKKRCEFQFEILS